MMYSPTTANLAFGCPARLYTGTPYHKIALEIAGNAMDIKYFKVMIRFLIECLLVLTLSLETIRIYLFLVVLALIVT